MAKGKEKRGLGRGLSALMADIDGPIEDDLGTVPRRADTTMPIENVVPNPDQPRKTFTDAELSELAASIAEKGVIQPLIVRPHPDQPGSYQIIAGERRWRAAQMAQLHELPIIIRSYDDTEVLEIAIIENIQRADLNPIEEAAGYRQLMERFGHTQDKLSGALGKSRSHIANLMRLLTLPQDVQDMLRDGRLSAGHARALVTLDDPSAAARRIVDEGLSVREAEKIGKPARPRGKPAPSHKDADTRALEQDLSAALGLKVTLSPSEDMTSGTLSIRYRTLEDLDDLCGRLTRQS